METVEVVTQVVELPHQIILNSTITGLGETIQPHRNEALQLGTIPVLINKATMAGTTIVREAIGVDPMEESTTVDSAVVVHLDLAVVAVELLLAVVAVAEQEEEETNLWFSNLKIETNVH
jgi:hypothetical protein